MLKCTMLGAFIVIEVNSLDPDQQKQPCLGPSFVQINLNKICLNHWIVVIAHPTDYIKKNGGTKNKILNHLSVNVHHH